MALASGEFHPPTDFLVECIKAEGRNAPFTLRGTEFGIVIKIFDLAGYGIPKRP